MEFGQPVSLDTPLGTINFNPVAGGDGFYLTAFNGMDGATVRNTVSNLPQRDGALVQDSYRGSRNPVLEGEIRFTQNGSLAYRTQLEDQLRSYTNSILRADGILRFSPSGQPERQVTVRLLEALQISGGLIKSFQLALVAADPLTYSSTLNMATTSAFVIGAGSTWNFPFHFPFTFGNASSGGTANATNNGNSPTYPTIRFYGPMSSPTLANTTTGEEMIFTGLIVNAGDFIEVNTQNETAFLNGSSSNPVLYTLDIPNSEFFSLNVGTNIIQLIATGTSTSSNATIYWRDAYV